MDATKKRENPVGWLCEVRGLDPEVLVKMGVDGALTRDGSPYVRFRYFRDGRPIFMKCRAVDEKRFWKEPKGKDAFLYNFDVLSDPTLFSEPVVIVEGEIDCITLVQCGFARTVSVPDGWAERVKDEGARRAPLNEAVPLLEKSPCVIVAGDADAPGASLAHHVRNLLEPHAVRAVVWPDGCKDANDVLRQHGPDAVARCIREARMMDPEGGIICGFSDLPPMPPRTFLRSNHPALKSTVCYEVGNISVVTGVPTSGKSTFATFAAHHMQHDNDIRVGLALFETHPDSIRDQLCMLRLGRQWESLDAWEKESFKRQLDLHYRLIFRDEKSDTRHNIGWLESMIKTAAVRDGCKLIIIDPWNEIDHLPEPGESMTNYINFALTRVRQLAERYQTHVQIVTHPAKMKDSDKVPKGYDIADSAAWFNKPSLGVTVARVEGVYGANGIFPVDIHTWKVKYWKEYGIETGAIRLNFDRNSLAYFDPECSEEEHKYEVYSRGRKSGVG